MRKRIITYCNPGLIDYKKAWDLQKEVHQLRVENKIDDTIFLLEHPHTYTLGKVADKNHLIGSEEYLNRNKISVYDIDRGGDITYHGPGQIVGYPIINLNNWYNDTHKYLRALEEVIILTCSEFGLTGIREPKYTGVWLENSKLSGRAAKIAAIGIKVSRWVTMHGFAFNVNTDLSLFSGIIPCGISDKEVTSLKNETGSEKNIEEVKDILLKNFKKVFDYAEINIVEKEELFLQSVTDKM